MNAAPGMDVVARLREEMPVTRRWTYLNHASIGPLTARGAQRVTDLAAGAAAGGDRLWPERNDGCERVRELAAKLLGARRPHEIAFAENTSAALSLVAQGIDWRPGDNVVTAAGEFPSNVYPWMQLGERGVELRPAPERDGRIETADLLARMDGRTRVLALSWVEYATGFRFDLAALAAECRARGILFVVDAIQGLGALGLDVEREGVDVCAAAAHKWLLGPEGIALLYIADRVVEAIRPVRSGWRSMREQTAWTELALDWAPGALRHECGTLNTPGIHALGGSLEVLLEADALLREAGTTLEKRVVDLTDRAARGLVALGFEVVGTRPPALSSGIVAASHPRHRADDLVAALADRDVVTAARVGRLRIAPHFYNTEDEIDLLLGELAAILGTELPTP